MDVKLSAKQAEALREVGRAIQDMVARRDAMMVMAWLGADLDPAQIHLEERDDGTFLVRSEPPEAPG